MKDWFSFLKIVTVGFVTALTIVFAFIVLVDPYDCISFSPKYHHCPYANNNQRFGYPSIARSKKFDSFVMGTSTSQLLEPKGLNKLFGAKFANLSLSGSTSYEQYRLMNLFLDHNPNPKFIIWGLDLSWFTDEASFTKYHSHLHFPEWLYSDKLHNKLTNLLNLETLKQSLRQVRYKLKLKRPSVAESGYSNPLLPKHRYDLGKAQLGIYTDNNFNRVRTELTVQRPHLTKKEMSTLSFPPHAFLKEMLDRIPKTTNIIIVFPPYHYSISTFNTEACEKWAHARQQIASICRAHPNVVVLDFMIKSEITKYDGNYWDSIHHTQSVVPIYQELIHQGFTSKTSNPKFFNCKQ